MYFLYVKGGNKKSRKRGYEAPLCNIPGVFKIYASHLLSKNRLNLSMRQLDFIFFRRPPTFRGHQKSTPTLKLLLYYNIVILF